MRISVVILGRSAVLAAVLALGGGAVTVMPARADHCAPTMPTHPRDVRGYTFAARIVDIEGVGTVITPTITFAVERVYAGGGKDGLVAGRNVEVIASGCGGIDILGIAVGDEVLMSTSTLTDGPSTFNSAIWRISEGRLRLLAFGGADIWPTGDRRLQAAATLREALALVAPGVIMPPDTATVTGPIATATPSPNDEPPLLPFAMIGLAALLASVTWLTIRHMPLERALASRGGVERPLSMAELVIEG